ncbi:MAG: succinate dehydrogenase [Rhodobacteraceae bacterium]|nr:succinate dehydrogenase [Paracoccaceae bacterium]
MLDLRFFLLQRFSAMIMAPLVLGHIVMMIYAIQGGLSTAEILGRTQGSVFWAAYYGVFVIAVSVHAAIGLRVIIAETMGLKSPALGVFTWSVCLVSLVLGLYAVWAVVAL